MIDRQRNRMGSQEVAITSRVDQAQATVSQQFCCVFVTLRLGGQEVCNILFRDARLHVQQHAHVHSLVHVVHCGTKLD